MFYLPSEYQAQLWIYWSSFSNGNNRDWDPFIYTKSDICELIDDLDTCIAESMRNEIHDPIIQDWIRFGHLF